MKPRARGIGCRLMRDSHAKCVKIYRSTPQAFPSLCRFQLIFAMAPTLLISRKGLGRNQPFDPGTMNVTQEAAAKPCQAPADRAVLHCTEPRRQLFISSWGLTSFQPTIHLSRRRYLRKGTRICFQSWDGVSPQLRQLAGFRAKRKRLVCLTEELSATRNFPGLIRKKPLARGRAKIL
jgi:hypothetical protein